MFPIHRGRLGSGAPFAAFRATEQIMNIAPDPEAPAAPEPGPPARSALPRVSTRLAAIVTDQALESGRDRRPGRGPRHDGWSPERIRLFLATLAETGVAADAARAAGMSVQGAYALRNRAAGRAFHLAWNAALQLARRRLADEVMSRALHGVVDVIVRDGEVWAERHRFDNRLTMSVLARLDRQALQDDRENEDARLVAEEFDEFVDLVSAGGDGADRFIGARRTAERRFCPSREARLLRRLENYRRASAGMPGDQEPDP